MKAPRFKKSVSESVQVSRKRESMSLTVDGWDVHATREDGGQWIVGVDPSFSIEVPFYARNQCSIYSMRPRTVAELVEFANVIGPVLKKAARAFRAEGITDFRTKDQRKRDEQERRDGVRIRKRFGLPPLKKRARS